MTGKGKDSHSRADKKGAFSVRKREKKSQRERESRGGVTGTSVLLCFSIPISSQFVVEV